MTGRRRRLRPDERRLELIEAAERVLREKGLGARVEDVVAAAGAAKGTFYLYFPSWEELLLEIRSRIFTAFHHRHLGGPRHAIDPDWRALAAELSAAFVDFTLELAGQHEAIFHGPIAGRPPRDGEFDAVSIIADLLRAGTAGGAFSVEDADATARLLFAVLHETADAIQSGADRARSLAAMHALIGRAIFAAP